MVGSVKYFLAVHCRVILTSLRMKRILFCICRGLENLNPYRLLTFFNQIGFLGKESIKSQGEFESPYERVYVVIRVIH